MDTELIKLFVTNLPTIAIAIGVAKIYYKVASTFERMSQQIANNTEDISNLKDIHIDRHPEDAIRVYSRRKSDE